MCLCKSHFSAIFLLQCTYPIALRAEIKLTNYYSNEKIIGFSTVIFSIIEASSNRTSTLTKAVGTYSSDFQKNQSQPKKTKA